MNRKELSGNPPSEGPAVAPDEAAAEPGTRAMYETAAGVVIDFHSPEFNQIDKLNDYAADYRNFQPLDGVVTAEMLHRAARSEGRAIVDNATDGAASPEGNGLAGEGPAKRDGEKHEREYEEGAAIAAGPSLTVVSHGRTLVIGPDASRCTDCARLLGDQGVDCTLLVINPAGSRQPLPRGTPLLLEADATSITGAFGGFSAMVALGAERKPLSAWLGDEARSFDLVLDLQPLHSFAGNRLPLGYFAPGTDPAALEEAMTELPEMRGRFRRPQFTLFLKERCIHGRSRSLNCDKCVAVCPFGAIRSANGVISVDHHRCQGCGCCAMVCPAEAIRRISPSQEELLIALRRALNSRPVASSSAPILVISERESAGPCKPGAGEGEGERYPDREILFEVEQIGHAGLEMLLSGLAWGAGAVVLSCGPKTPPAVREALEGQIETGRAILRGVGLLPQKIRLADGWAGECPLEAAPKTPPFPLSAISSARDKRTVVRRAAQHLYDQSGLRHPFIPLPAGSPFGAVAVDATGCTLCMACAAACPSRALFSQGKAPKLEFIESRCHQCGVCQATCPEGAIRLVPRLLCDSVALETPVTLHAAKPACCVECGAPFAPGAMIDRIREKLAGHWMYAEERQLRRLRMCGECRTRDALLSRDVKRWNR